MKKFSSVRALGLLLASIFVWLHTTLFTWWQKRAFAALLTRLRRFFTCYQFQLFATDHNSSTSFLSTDNVSFSLFLLQQQQQHDNLHDEISIHIRSFHLSPDRAFFGTNEGLFFLGCLIKVDVFCCCSWQPFQRRKLTKQKNRSTLSICTVCSIQWNFISILNLPPLVKTLNVTGSFDLKSLSLTGCSKDRSMSH